MSQLSAKNLPEHTRSPSYDRDAVTIGIVHFGIGNFHRAHQAVYVDDLLTDGSTQWGIAGVSLRSSTIQEALKPQDYLYTLAVLGETTEYRVIGSIKDILAAPQNPQAVIDLLAKPTTQLVSSTITEKGYYLASGEVDFEHPVLQSEFVSLENPTTIYGYLARGVIARFQNAESSKLTILCCDNISAGGERLKDGVEYLLEKHNADALAWSRENLTFISSMVDRVSPATDDALRASVFRETKRDDAAPVSTEPFTQWIIENHFAGQRPEFARVGAVFVDDIAPFERMKLSYLNAAHTIVSTLGYLSGDTFVHESLHRLEVSKFMRQTLHENILPNSAVPEGYDGATYIEEVVKRFQNGNLPYANLQVATDSSQKIQQRWFPTIDQALSQNADCSCFALCLAAWVIFVQTALEKGVLNDPKAAAFKHVCTEDIDQIVMSYLKIAEADRFGFYNQPSFLSTVKHHANSMKTGGITRALIEFLDLSEDNRTNVTKFRL